MKEVEFYCDENGDISETAKICLANLDKYDPSSIYYKRVLERPNVNWLQVIRQIAIPIILFIVSVKLLLKRWQNFSEIIFITSICMIIYILLRFKNIIICLIHIYQHFAPDSIRMKCRFEPSCSQYMILALEKYGVLKGSKMGINRLKRCKVGNGGYDFP